MIVAQPKPHKKPGKRALPDHSQPLRHSIQILFLALNVWIGIQFYLFVRYYETGGRSLFATRPAGVEGWLPIAALMNLKVLLSGGGISKIHPAGTFLVIAFLAASLLFRKSFCGWLCPVGTISEYLWRFGRKILKASFRLPRIIDVPLRSVKYLLMALFVYAVAIMPVPAIHQFLASPYGVVDDVKMLNFFREIGSTGAIVLGLLALGR